MAPMAVTSLKQTVAVGRGGRARSALIAAPPEPGRHSFQQQLRLDRKIRACEGVGETEQPVVTHRHGCMAAQNGDTAMAEVDEMARDCRRPAPIVGGHEGRHGIGGRCPRFAA
jgi:hypothetical protein